MRRTGGAAVVLAVLGALGAGCGGGDTPPAKTAPTPTAPTTTDAQAAPSSPPSSTRAPQIDPAVLPPRSIPTRATGPADPAAIRVINAWLAALRHGDIERAASYFAVPSVFQNATPVLHLDSRQEVLAVNLSFPCGAVAIRYGGAGRYTMVRVKLTARIGGDCHGAEGATTGTAIRVSGGRIREWYRIYETRETGPPPSDDGGADGAAA